MSEKDQKNEVNKECFREQRHFIRHPMCFPLKFKVLKKGTWKSSREQNSASKNISRNGLLFTSTSPVSAGSVILLKIPFQDKIFKVRARVVHCNKLPDLALWDVGVSFLRVNEAFKVKLIEQMYLISEYRDIHSLQEGKEISLQEASQEWIRRYSERFKRLYW